jgi:hypothetical protein
MANKVKPIKPSEVASKKGSDFPDAVFEAFNELIARDFHEGSATVLQSDVVELMIKKGLKREEIYEHGWLNVEEAYRAAGWGVEYDKPGYNETYRADFTFTARKSRQKDNRP